MRLQYRPRIIPVLLISNQGLYKTKRFKNPEYLGDPINAVKIFNECGVDELCILDISRTKSKQIDFEYLEGIAAEAFMPLSYGGGITTIEQIHRLYRIGFEKVVINSSFFDKPSLVEEASKEAGSQSVVVSIDVKKDVLNKYSSWIQGGTIKKKMDPVNAAIRAQELGAGEILLQSIDNDGIMRGYDYGIIKKVAAAVNIPVIACGGSSGISDMAKVLNESNASAVAAGSMFVYYGKKKAVLINYPTEKELIDGGVYR